MTSVPLRYRLPNPPADFVGRKDDVARVAESLREAHVTILVGPGGVGKTALALHVLHKRFPKRVPRILYVSLGREMDGIELRHELLRALAAAAGAEVGWAQLQDHGDALSEAVLDVAEGGPYWVLLDDLHHVAPGEADSLLEALSSYARSSRYLVTSRTAPNARLASGRVLPIDGLDEDATLELARQLASDRPPGEIAAAARASGGSPWLLRQALVLSSAHLEGNDLPSHETLLIGLTEPARRFVLVLSRLDIPIPLAILNHASAIPEESWRPELAARGWLQETPGGVRLHDVARHGITSGGERLAEASLWLPVALTLARNSIGAVRLEGIRLLLEADALDAAEQALDEALDRLLAEGYAPQLWKLLDRVPPPRLDGIRLRCAAELGNPTVLRQLSQPLGGSPADRLTWAETLYMRGDLAGAMKAVQHVLDDGRPEANACRFDGELLRARLLLAQDRVKQAHDVLTALRPSSPAEALRRDALLQWCVTPRREEPAAAHNALTSLQALQSGATELRDRAGARVRFQLAVAYLRHQALDAAETVLDLPPSGDTADTLALFEARRASWLKATIDVARGRLASAQERLEQLDPFLSSPSLIRAEVHCTRARLWMARGEFGEVFSLLGNACAEAESLGVLATARRCERLQRYAEEIALVNEGHERRAAHAERLLADLEEGARSLEREVTRSAATGHLVRATELRTELCAALLLLERSAELERELEELRRAAVHMGSQRWHYEADLLAMSRETDWARLELLALHPEVSPIAARRARALLSPEAPPPLDPLDRALLDKLRPTIRPALVVAGPPDEAWHAGWGFDARGRRLWLPSGEWLDLTRRDLLARLVLVLAAHGGAATKEQLVEEAWQEPEYHPLRHDTRLHVTVHKLRELLETDPGAPRLLLTTKTGYALAGPFRLVPEADTASAHLRLVVAK